MKNTFYLHVETGNGIDEPRESTTSEVSFNDNLVWDEDMIEETRRFLSEIYDVPLKAVKTSVEAELDEISIRMMEEGQNYNEAEELMALTDDFKRKHDDMMEHLRSKKDLLCLGTSEEDMFKRMETIYYKLKDYPTEMTQEYLEEFTLMKELYSRRKWNNTNMPISFYPKKMKQMEYFINIKRMEVEMMKLKQHYSKMLLSEQ